MCKNVIFYKDKISDLLHNEKYSNKKPKICVLESIVQQCHLRGDKSDSKNFKLERK